MVDSSVWREGREGEKESRGLWWLRWKLAGFKVYERKTYVSAPEKQPCPQCKAWRSRFQKTLNMAFYTCNKCHIKFAVRLKEGS